MPNKTMSAGLLCAATLLASTAGVKAADLDSIYGGLEPIAEQKVEFGSGWYVGGNIAAEQNYKLDSSSVLPNTVPSFSSGRSNVPGYDLSLSAGYKFLNWLRADVVGDFHQPLSTSYTGAAYACPLGVYGTPTGGPFTGSAFQYGNCSPNVAKSLKSYDVLVNGYADIGTWYNVTPYVGAGVGVSFGHYSTSAHWFAGNNVAYNFNYTDPVSGAALNFNYDRSAGRSYQNLAYALMAGVGIGVFDHTTLDIGYRFLDIGRVAGTNISYNEARVGLRYLIDN